MVGSLTKTNAFIVRPYKAPMGHSATLCDILSHKTSDALLIHTDSRIVS